MSGLEKIINEINEEADRTVGEIISYANSSAEKIISRAEERAREIEAEANEKAEEEYKKSLQKAHSSAEVTKKRAILKEKQEIISEVLSGAHSSIIKLGTDRYFDLMIKLLMKYADEGGEIILSERDKTWVTPQFREVADKKGLKISDEIRDIDGGFILLYGDIEENCSFSALMEEERDRLHDAVNTFLF
jgi:V/A-type H+-transporting ATPase subunit E